MKRLLACLTCILSVACGRTAGEPIDSEGWCGDGLVLGWEECDDANGDGFDGCSACRVSEFLVARSILFMSQAAVSVAVDGRFAVVWADWDGDGDGVFGRVFVDGEGGPVFRANDRWRNDERSPDVAAAGGGFVVAWTSNGQDGDDLGVFARIYGPDGTSPEPEFQVNERYLGNQSSHRVAAGAAGGSVLAWDSDDYSVNGVFARLLGEDGSPLGSELRVSPDLEGYQSLHSVMMDGYGGFIVAWIERTPPSDERVLRIRRYGPDGSALGSVITLDVPAAVWPHSISMAMAADGSFVVVWGVADEEDRLEAYGRRYDRDGSPVGPVFPVTDGGVPSGVGPYMAMGADGRFVVMWSEMEDSAHYDVERVTARLFDEDGSPRTPGLCVVDAAGIHINLFDVAAAPRGGFIVVWEAGSPAWSERFLLAQRFDERGAPLGLAPW